jgi:hypothetical protein
MSDGLLRKKRLESPGIMVNEGEHRAEENTCQYKTLEGHLREQDRPFLTRKDELRSVINTLQGTVNNPPPIMKSDRVVL